MSQQTQTKQPRRIGRSILAVIAGFIITFVLSYGTDFILMATGAMARNGKLPLSGSETLVASVLVYRIIFSAVGAYVAARLAPAKPMTHALVLGALGCLAAVGGAISMSAQAPSWYSWGIAIFALPTAWLGGKLYTIQTTKGAPKHEAI